MRRFVETLAGAAIPQAKIAAALAVTVPTLRKYYRREIDRGAAVVEAQLATHLLRIASGKDGTALKALMFTLQCRFGWSRFAPPRR